MIWPPNIDDIVVLTDDEKVLRAACIPASEAGEEGQVVAIYEWADGINVDVLMTESGRTWCIQKTELKP